MSRNKIYFCAVNKHTKISNSQTASELSLLFSATAATTGHSSRTSPSSRPSGPVRFVFCYSFARIFRWLPIRFFFSCVLHGGSKYAERKSTFETTDTMRVEGGTRRWQPPRGTSEKRSPPNWCRRRRNECSDKPNRSSPPRLKRHAIVPLCHLVAL